MNETVVRGWLDALIARGTPETAIIARPGSSTDCPLALAIDAVYGVPVRVSLTYVRVLGTSRVLAPTLWARYFLAYVDGYTRGLSIFDVEQCLIMTRVGLQTRQRMARSRRRYRAS
jgi:hypothetical protein